MSKRSTIAVLLVWMQLACNLATAQTSGTAAISPGTELVYLAVPEWYQDGRQSKENNELETRAKALRESLTTSTGLHFIIRRDFPSSYLQGHRLLIRTVKPIPRAEAETVLQLASRQSKTDIQLIPLDVATEAAVVSALRRGIGIDGENVRPLAFVGKRVVDVFATRSVDLASKQALVAESVLWPEFGTRRLGCYYASEGGRESTVPILFWYQKQPEFKVLEYNFAGFVEANSTLVDTALLACPSELSGAYGRFAKALAFAPEAKPGAQFSDARLRQIFGPLTDFVKFAITVQEASRQLPGPKPDGQASANSLDYERWRDQQEAKKRAEVRDQRNCQHYAFITGDTQMFHGCY